MIDGDKDTSIRTFALPLFVLLFLLFVITVRAEPPQRSNDYQFVGFSTGTINGGQGMMSDAAKVQLGFM